MMKNSFFWRFLHENRMKRNPMHAAETHSSSGWTGGPMDGWMDMKFLPIVQDFVPLSGLLHCYPLRFYHIKEAGKGYH